MPALFLVRGGDPHLGQRIRLMGEADGHTAVTGTGATPAVQEHVWQV